MIFGWVVSIGIIIALVYELFPYANDVEVPKIDELPRVAYGALNRFAWTVAVEVLIKYNFLCLKMIFDTSRFRPLVDFFLP